MYIVIQEVTQRARWPRRNWSDASASPYPLWFSREDFFVPDFGTLEPSNMFRLDLFRFR